MQRLRMILVVVIVVFVGVCLVAIGASMAAQAKKAPTSGNDDPNGAWHLGIQPIDPKSLETPASVGGSSHWVKVNPDGNNIHVTFPNPRLTPKAPNGVPESQLISAKSVNLASWYLHLKGRTPYFRKAENVDGEVNFVVPNYAMSINQPVVDHWTGTDDQSLHLVLDPADPFVTYFERKDANGKIGPDLNTLIVGVLMCPNGDVHSLKQLKLGKIVQGVHPELAGYCK